ncbi:MAG: hypothetical protein Q8K34_20795, partial [Hydrogenophaga sp.]|nr:hypothetical protein [Hydrogenophaga sp.]
YTNRDTVSIGVGVILKDMVDRAGEAYALLERFKAQPQVRRLIQGASPREYAAHLIPEGGYRGMPKLYGNGVLVVGDAAGMVNAAFTEGANLAVIETKSAGELLFRERQEGLWLASPIQIYLDLLRGEGRSKEMAEHFRKERIGF